MSTRSINIGVFLNIILIYFIGFLYTFRGQFYITSSLSLFSLLIIFYFGFNIVFVKKNKFTLKEILVFIILIGYPLIPNNIALYKFGQFELADYVRLVEGILIFFMFYNIDFAKRNYKYLFYGMLTSCVYSVLLNFEEIYNYILFGKFTLFVNPLYQEINYAFSYYILILSFCMMKILSNEDNQGIVLHRKLIYIVSLGIISLAGLLSASRAGYIGLTILLLFSFVIFAKKKNILKTSLILVIVVISVIKFAPMFDGIYNVMSTRFSDITNPYGGKVDPRFIIWIDTIKLNLLNPLGIGMNNVRYYTEFGIPEHNTILQAWSTYGFVIFFLIFITIKQIFFFIKTISFNCKIDLLIGIILISYMPFILTLNLMTSRHFWFILALLFARNKMKRKVEKNYNKGATL